MFKTNLASDRFSNRISLLVIWFLPGMMLLSCLTALKLR